MSDLLSCPCCDEDAMYNTDENQYRTPKIQHFVECRYCRLRTALEDTKKEAAELWNKRT